MNNIDQSESRRWNGWSTISQAPVRAREVRIDRDEAAAELLAVVDAHEPRVVLGAGVAEREQLVEQTLTPFGVASE